jgi:hypothetical protein
LNIKKLRQSYHIQKHSATKLRGIEFLLSFEEWLQIWLDSGHLHERGKDKDQYCMARYGDRGAYAIGNVRIITNSENSRENLLGKPMKASTKQKLREINTGRKHTEETKIKMGKNCFRPNWLGRKHTEETKIKQSIAARKRPKRKLSEEHKLNIGAANRGKKRSEEAKQNIREGALRRVRKPRCT